MYVQTPALARVLRLLHSPIRSNLSSFKITGSIAFTTRGAGVPAAFSAARQHFPLASVHTQPSWTRPTSWHFKFAIPLLAGKNRHSQAALSMPQQQQAVAVSQPSGSVEQTETTVDIPLSISTPANKAKKSLKPKQSANGNDSVQLSDALIPGPAFGESLADRIKAGTGRRRTTQQKAHVPSAAVVALAETVDRALAPEEGTTERYLDSRDADLNVPTDIPGASEEQQQHAATSANAADFGQQAAGQSAAHAAAETGQGAVAKSKKPKRHKKDSNGNKDASLQPASQFAQGPSVVTDMLEENDKVRLAF